MKVGQRVTWESIQSPGRYHKGKIVRIEAEYRPMDYDLIEIPKRLLRRRMSLVAFPVIENTWAIVECDFEHKLQPVRLCRLQAILPPTHRNAKGGGSAPPARGKVILGAAA